MFEWHATLIIFGKRYITFEVDEFAKLGFRNASESNSNQSSLFDVLQTQHAL